MFPNTLTLCSVVLFVFFSFVCEFNCEVNLRRACSEETFYKPYVEILARRGGEPLFQFERPGFIDLRNQYEVYLCINGPAFLYRNIEKLSNVTSTVFQLTSFKNPDFRVFRHECIVINRYVSDMFGGPGTEEEIRKTGGPIPLMKDWNIVHGYKVFGVTLMGHRKDYRIPAFHMFTGPNFEDNAKSLVMGASFAVIGRYHWTAYDKFTNTHLVVNPYGAKTDDYICRYYYNSVKANKDFDKVLQRGHKREDYRWTQAPTLAHTLIAEPRWNSKVFKSLTPIYISDENQMREYAYEYPKDTTQFLKKPVSTVIVTTEENDCQELKPYEDLCAEANRLSSEDDACQVVKSVLELEPRDWKKPPITDLKWKGDIIDMIEQIFVKVCPRVDANVAESIADVFMDKYVLEIHKAQGSLNRVESPEWKTLMTHLTECRDKAETLIFNTYTKIDKPWKGPYVEPFYFFAPEGNQSILRLSNEDENGKRIEVKRNYHNETEDHPEWKMLPLVVRTADGRDAAVFHFEEAVEGDFQFNLVVDHQWKIFSTVVGYCSKFKKPTIIMDYIAKFNEEFMKPIKTDWLYTRKNDIYAYLIGEDEIALDECLEGAYLHSGNHDFRALRELEINPGYSKQVTVNHFTRVPPENYFQN